VAAAVACQPLAEYCAPPDVGAALTTRLEVKPPAGLELGQVTQLSTVRSEPARSAAAATAAAA
jgi:hypothetical protein